MEGREGERERVDENLEEEEQEGGGVHIFSSPLGYSYARGIGPPLDGAFGQ